MRTQDMTIAINGQSMPCYLTRPDGDAPKPAIIVLQEVFGVNTEVKRITDLVASAGYVGLAINFYFRTHPKLNEPYTPQGLQTGFAAAGQLTKANLLSDIRASMDWLNAQAFVAHGKLMTWGFCLGGSVAFLSATLPGLCGAIGFYGGMIAAPFPNGEPEGLSHADELRVPLLLAFGAKDDYIGPEAVGRIASTLTAARKQFELLVYPEVGHAFFRQSSAAMNHKEVQDAWEHAKAFMKTATA